MQRESVSSPIDASTSAAFAGKVDALLGQAEERWRHGGVAGVGEAVCLCDELLCLLPGEAVEERARVWLRRGQFLESARVPAALADAVSSHEAGLKSLDRGSGSSSWKESAATMRLRALLWMNRGNALVASSAAEAAGEAMRSYDAALEILGRDGGATEARSTVGAAWLNRSVAARLAASGQAGPCLEERENLDRAIHELALAAQEGSRPAWRNLAGAWLNRAAWCEAAGDAAGAWAAWSEAIGSAAPEARRDGAALETGLRARHALCVATARRLTAREILSAVEAAELVAQVETGLADFAASAAIGRTQGAREVADRLFEFGAWFLRTRVPGRLAEFLSRHISAEAARRLVVARLAMEMARQEIIQAGFGEMLSEAGREARERLQALGAVEERLIPMEEACRQSGIGR